MVGRQPPLRQRKKSYFGGKSSNVIFSIALLRLAAFMWARISNTSVRVAPRRAGYYQAEPVN